MDTALAGTIGTILIGNSIQQWFRRSIEPALGIVVVTVRE
jgi:hypothetical protein